MLSELETKFHELEQILSETLQYMDQLPESELSKVIDDQWNAIEILYHLFISELGTTNYLVKKLRANKADVPDGGLGAKLRSKLLLAALRNKKKKYKAPQIIAKMDNISDFSTVKNNLIENRKAMKLVLDQFDESMSKKAYFKHPIAGRLNISQTLDFLIAHFSRHAVQIHERSKA